MPSLDAGAEGCIMRPHQCGVVQGRRLMFSVSCFSSCGNLAFSGLLGSCGDEDGWGLRTQEQERRFIHEVTN
ncbi:hypothetical protein BDA96_05G015400 [Sorghum bicolor]|uniref:Uncharacterized protein n=1 Tax=Sorghum bicolor TaxID=4558 RepID=A0A921UED3_SORBI|nr:hypothetical protein BDA96_05G015400 [Sorghum bicolor]